MSPDFDAKQWHFVEELRNIAENVQRAGKSAVPMAVQRLWEIGAVPDIHATSAGYLTPWERVEWYAGQLHIFLQRETMTFVSIFLDRMKEYVPKLPEVEISPTDFVFSQKQQKYISELRHIVNTLEEADEWYPSAQVARDALRDLGAEPCDDTTKTSLASEPVSHARTEWYAGRLLYLLDVGRFRDAGFYIDALDRFVPKLPEPTGQIELPEPVTLGVREQIEAGLAAIEPLEGDSIVELAEYMNDVHHGCLAARKLLLASLTPSEREVLEEDRAILRARFDRTVRRMTGRANE